jgi:hypothetical protein
MAPTHTVLIGHVNPVKPTHRSSRKLRQAPNEVVIGRVKPSASRQQLSASRKRKEDSIEVILQAPTHPPLEEEDVLEAGDELDEEAQAKVCAFIAEYLIFILTIFRHLWGYGSSIVTDISTCYWRCRVSPRIPPAPCAPTQRRSNVMSAVVPITFAGHVALKHIRDPHIIA